MTTPAGIFRPGTDIVGVALDMMCSVCDHLNQISACLGAAAANSGSRSAACAASGINAVCNPSISSGFAAAVDCGAAFFPLSGCATSILQTSGCLGGVAFADNQTGAFVDSILCLRSAAFGCTGPLGVAAGIAVAGGECALQLDGFDERRRRLRSRRQRDDARAVHSFILTAHMVANYADLQANLFGNPAVTQIHSSNWSAVWAAAVASDSPGGAYLTTTEVAAVITALPTDSAVNQSMLSTYVLYHNRTLEAISAGNASGSSDNEYMNMTAYAEQQRQYAADTDVVIRNGFPDIMSAHVHAAAAVEAAAANPRGGVCASVRLRIEQELTLTRTAFEARLELSNGGESALTNVSVTFRITRPGVLGSQAAHFAIGDPALTEITGLNGSGVLLGGATGVATWLMMPYGSAAPLEDTVYLVGGTLQHTVDGATSSHRLYPATITVRPDASIHVRYFLPRHVLGDDPFTRDVVEPQVPVTLGMLMTNNGHGAAADVSLVSGQPEIVDNERGLLVSFQIVGAILGDAPVVPSLRVHIGDFPPRSAVQVRWLMTASLSGRFTEFNASFVGSNPLGDPELNLVRGVEAHTLAHVVWLTGPDNDGLPDFLADDAVEPANFPEAVYDSRNGTTPHPVRRLRVTNTTFAVGNVAIVECELVLAAEYAYLKLANPYPGLYPEAVQVTQPGQPPRNVTVGYNAWRTVWVTHLASGAVQVDDDVHAFAMVAPGPVLYTMRFGASAPPTMAIPALQAPSGSPSRSAPTQLVTLTQSPTFPPTVSLIGSPTASPEPGSTPGPSQDPTPEPTGFPASSTPTRRGETWPPSSAPSTSVPSSRPTISPSPFPTRTPSALPTVPPSTSPSLSPTLAPTLSPTLSPTASPTFSPSRSPTLSPSAAPTTAPSTSPTTSPSALPSLSPTISPSSTSQDMSTSTKDNSSNSDQSNLWWILILFVVLIFIILAIKKCKRSETSRLSGHDNEFNSDTVAMTINTYHNPEFKAEQLTGIGGAGPAEHTTTDSTSFSSFLPLPQLSPVKRGRDEALPAVRVPNPNIAGRLSPELNNKVEPSGNDLQPPHTTQTSSSNA